MIETSVEDSWQTFSSKLNSFKKLRRITDNLSLTYHRQICSGIRLTEINISFLGTATIVFDIDHVQTKHNFSLKKKQ